MEELTARCHQGEEQRLADDVSHQTALDELRRQMEESLQRTRDSAHESQLQVWNREGEAKALSYRLVYGITLKF